MKKIIGILGVVVFAMTMFLNLNQDNNNNNDNRDLAGILAINTANAESYKITIIDCDQTDDITWCEPDLTGNRVTGCEVSWFWDDCYFMIHV